MNRSTLKTKAIALALVLAFSSTMLLATALDFSELHDATQVDRDLQDAQHQAQTLAKNSRRLAIAADAICAREQGAGALPRWTPDGELLCLPVPLPGSTKGGAL
jgi:hypothetical protein